MDPLGLALGCAPDAAVFGTFLAVPKNCPVVGCALEVDPVVSDGISDAAGRAAESGLAVRSSSGVSVDMSEVETTGVRAAARLR